MISKIIELETLTPLFIKGKDLDYGEGMLRGRDGLVYLIDNDKLCEYIADKNKIEEYAKDFDGKNKKYSLKSFLKINNIYPDDSELRKIAKGITEMSEKAPKDDEEQKNNFIQNGKRNPYIPGTSLKGAIRNAIIWKFLEEDNNNALFNDFFDSQRKSLDNQIQGIAIIVDALEKARNKDFDGAERNMGLVLKSSFEKKYIFEKKKESDCYIYHNDTNSVETKLRNYQRNFAKIFSKNKFKQSSTILSILKLEQIPQTKQDIFYMSKKDFDKRWQKAKRNQSLVDFFRLVKVSDGNIVQNTSLDWLQAKTVCRDNVGQTYQKEHTTTLECLPKNIKAHFKITIDTELAKSFYPDGVPRYMQSVEELLNVVSDYFRNVAYLDCEEFYSYAKTINNNTEGKKNVDTNQIEILYKSTFGLSPNETLFRTGWGGGFMSKTQFLHMNMTDRVRVRDMIHYNGSPLAPKSRCLIVEGEKAKEPLGWCKLRILGDAKDMSLPSIDTATIKTELITQQNKQNAKGNHINSGKPLTEREVQKSNTTAKAILKQAEKKNTNATQVTYKAGQTVYATVEECVPFLSLKVIIGDQVLIINKGVIKQKGETVQIQITKVENGKILAAKLL
jgi:CRISPR type III-A-associated RAMP protein Csm5